MFLKCWGNVIICHNSKCTKCVIVKCTTLYNCTTLSDHYLKWSSNSSLCHAMCMHHSTDIMTSLRFPAKKLKHCFAVAWLFYFSILAQRSTCDFQTYPVWPRDLHGQQGRCYFLNFVSGKVLANGNLQGVVKTWNWMPWDPQMDWSFLRLKGLKFLFPSNSKNSFHGFLRVRVTCFFGGKFHLQ